MFGVLWGKLQPHLAPKERKGAYLAGWIKRCAPESNLSDLSDLSDQTPAVLHKVIESLKIRLDHEEEKNGRCAVLTKEVYQKSNFELKL